MPHSVHRKGRDQLNVWVTARTRRMWRQTLRLARTLTPGLTADRMVSEMLRAYRLRLVRTHGAARVTEILGPVEADTTCRFDGPPDRPRNVR